MASDSGLKEMVRRLVNAFPRMGASLSTADVLAEWRLALQPFTDTQLSAATTDVISECEHPPTIARLVAACRAVATNDGATRNARAEEARARDLRLARDDYLVRLADGQIGLISPPGAA